MQVQNLSPRISLYTPESPNQVDQLVIICSWADAQQRYITRYLELHQTITPAASILLIQTPFAALFKPYTWQRAALRPAAQYIIENALTNGQLPDGGQTQQGQSKNKTNILLHSCSNGGSLTASQLLILIREMTHAPLPLIGIIMDSSPDGGSYTRSHKAIVVAQPPSRPLRPAVSLLVHAALIPVWASYIIGGQENSQLAMRRIFLDRDYVDTLNICYIYSKSDTTTDWRDVLIHAEEARWKGWFVEEHKLATSSHCAHIRSDPEMYARIVRRIWESVKPRAKL